MTPLVIKNNWLKTSTTMENELDLYHYLIQIYCLFEGTAVSFSERSLLAYFMRWGISKQVEQKYMTDFMRKQQVVSNIKSSLVDKGLLEKLSRRTWKLPDQFSKRWTNLTIVLELNVTI